MGCQTEFEQRLEQRGISRRQFLKYCATMHSLDPCIGCAVHVIDPGDDRIYAVRAY